MDIKVTSLKGHNSDYFPNDYKEILINEIDQAKIIFNKPNLDWLEGRRYNDNKRVAIVIMGEIESYCDENDLICKQYLMNLSDENLQEWINKALIYSGESDYWYIYEKEF
jgi:hypothetical protein